MSEREQEQRDQVWDRATALLLWGIQNKLPWDVLEKMDEVQEAVKFDYPLRTIRDAWM